MKILSTLCGLALLTSCGTANNKADPVENPGSDSDDVLEAPAFDFKSANQFNTATKAFIVAGGSDIANFAQEVLDISTELTVRGINADEIACYFVPPTKSAYEQDKDQYDALRKRISACHIASLANLNQHVQLVDKASEVLFYMTSHGSQPLSRLISNLKDDPAKQEKYRNFVARFPIFDNHYFALDAVDEGLAGLEQKLDAINSGRNDVVLTTGAFTNLLSKWPAASKKYVVIQACYSGGFVMEQSSTPNLRSIENITVLTAAIHDRPSFGCGANNTYTYFGGSLIESLKSQQEGRSPFGLNYQQLFDATVLKVQDLESKLNAKPSLPQYFSNMN